MLSSGTVGDNTYAVMLSMSAKACGQLESVAEIKDFLCRYWSEVLYAWIFVLMCWCVRVSKQSG